MELKKIKKLYGESAMKYCRENFPLLLDQEGLLTSLLAKTIFDKKIFFKALFSQRKETIFKAFIYSQAAVEPVNIKSKASAKDILEGQGYVLFRCKTVEEVKAFKKFYREGEALCTFTNMSSRLNTCHIFWIVKKELLENIKAFDGDRKMKRQDPYGVSCCSIQFAKSGGYLSIKNRYNHKVGNPDATFQNNLDNIGDGLSQAFREDFSLKFSSNKNAFTIKGFTLIGGKFYKYAKEVNGRYYGKMWYQNESQKIIFLNKDYEVVIDNFLVNLKTKTLVDIVNSNKDFNNIKFQKIERFTSQEEFDKYPDEAGILRILEL